MHNNQQQYTWEQATVLFNNDLLAFDALFNFNMWHWEAATWALFQMFTHMLWQSASVKWSWCSQDSPSPEGRGLSKWAINAVTALVNLVLLAHLLVITFIVPAAITNHSFCGYVVWFKNQIRSPQLFFSSPCELYCANVSFASSFTVPFCSALPLHCTVYASRNYLLYL